MSPTRLFGVLLLLICIGVQGDDFFDEMEMLEDLEEVEFPAGLERALAKTPTREDVQRQPFRLVDFNDTTGTWFEPSDGDSQKTLERERFRLSWDSALVTDAEEGNGQAVDTARLRAGNIKLFWMKFLDPDSAGMTVEEEGVVDAQLEKLKEHEGLKDNDKLLNFGYMCRGKPHNAVMKLMSQLRHGRDDHEQRRLQEEASAQREKPLA